MIKIKKISALCRLWLALSALFCLCLGSSLVHAGEQLPPPPGLNIVRTMQPINSTLYKLTRGLSLSAKKQPTPEEIKGFAKKGMTLRHDGKVLVEIIALEGIEIDQGIWLLDFESKGLELGTRQAEVLVAKGLNVSKIQQPLTSYENRSEAWLPLSLLEDIAGKMPEGYRIQPIMPPNYDAVTGEGPVVTNSDNYQDAGQNGSGLTIAVIDGGFYGLSSAQTNGDAPSSYTEVNYTPYSFENEFDGTHGTGCVEAAFDHAPGATWRIYKIDSVTDMGSVVTDAIATGVDVITHSMSRYNLGWADNSGAACSAANDASSFGIIFFTSAGNRAESHFQGPYIDNDSNNWHNFGAEDSTITVTIESRQRGNHYLCWNNSAVDLDFYLYDSSLTNVIASSTNVGAGVFEEFYYINNTNVDKTFHLAVYRRSGSGDNTLEIFSHSSAIWDEHIVAENSTTSPSNATGSRVISVGAVSHLNFAQPNGSNVITNYSSQGPSNSGMTLPDLCGPTDTAGYTYASFGGTSAATPNAAGAACAFWSSNTLLNGYAIKWLLKEQADLWRDWGNSGNDNIYGKGGVFLADYNYGTRWMARSYNNTADSSTGPYYTLQAAHDAVPDNGRLLVFGDYYGSFSEAATLGSTGKSIMVEQLSDSGNALFGQ